VWGWRYESAKTNTSSGVIAMNAGWIQLHRKFTEWEWYSDINTKVLFIHCLLKANYLDKKWQGENIKRGSFLTSYQHLSQETGLSIQQVRTSISKLEKTGEVTRKSTSQLTELTICNYGTYQNEKDDSNKQVNNPVTNEQQTSNNQITTTNNNNNNKKEEEFTLPDFIDSELWDSYLLMRKKMKKPATEKAVTIAINALKQYEQQYIDGANKSLEQSILNGWQGVFEPKDADKKKEDWSPF
jgi:triphosphoribosyl-dephospho-CoA synthetase